VGWVDGGAGNDPIYGSTPADDIAVLTLRR
jgi:hypothetical protein